MQNKGFVKVFAFLLTLVCLFYLSFSFVTRHHMAKAAEDPKGEAHYLDSMQNEKVYLGAYSLKQCREMEIGLGLDLKGGMNVILEVSVPDVVKALADNKVDEAFNKAVAEALLNNSHEISSSEDIKNIATVSSGDEEIGKIIQALKEEGMYENALICYISDHGDMLGDHHHWRKTYPYEGSVHVPYIVKWPSKHSFPKGNQIDAPVELRDLLPTFIDIAGGQAPTDMDGQSLVELIKGNTNQWRKYIDLEHATCYTADNYWCALTDGKIKYVWRFHTGEEELFDMKNDPYELKNLVTEPSYQKQLKELRAAMVQHLSERGEEFVKDGKLQVLKRTVLYSPHFPDSNPVDTGI